MRKRTAALVLTGVLTFGTASLATAPVAVAQETTTDDGGNGRQGLWGLAGLLGLAGLAGLRRRDDSDRRSGGGSTRA